MYRKRFHNIGLVFQWENVIYDELVVPVKAPLPSELVSRNMILTTPSSKRPPRAAVHISKHEIVEHKLANENWMPNR